MPIKDADLGALINTAKGVKLAKPRAAGGQAGGFKLTVDHDRREIRAKKGNRNAGYLTMERYGDAAKNNEVFNMAVNPDFQRQGLMRQMHEEAEKHFGQINPSRTLSDDGFSFWKNWRPDAVKDSYRFHADKLMGQPVTHPSGETGHVSSVGDTGMTATRPSTGTTFRVPEDQAQLLIDAARGRTERASGGVVNDLGPTSQRDAIARGVATAADRKEHAQRAHERGEIPFKLGARFHTPKSKSWGEPPYEVQGHYVNQKTGNPGYVVSQNFGDDDLRSRPFPLTAPAEERASWKPFEPLREAKAAGGQAGGAGGGEYRLQMQHKLSKAEGGGIGDAGRTLPETEHTLMLQRQALMEGRKPAVLYPSGGNPAPDPPPGAHATETPDGVIHYNPHLLTEDDVHSAARDGRLNEILGLGPYNKSDVLERMHGGEPPLAVVSRDEHGHEAAGAWGTPHTAAEQAEALEAHMPEGGSISIEDPMQTLLGRTEKADGGGAGEPRGPRGPRGPKTFTGPIHSPVAGRTDHLPTHVPSGSYVIPADIIGAMGEGNTIAGFKHMRRMFGGNPYGEGAQPYGHKGGPYGKASGPYDQGNAPYGEALQGRADGGRTEAVPVVVAGGEYVLSPEEVIEAGGGDLDRGHRVLDAFVKRMRLKTIKTLQKLPGPKKD